MKLYKVNYRIFFPLFIAIMSSNCKKLVEIDPPKSTITTTQVFATDAEATAAISGVYFKMINNYSHSMFNGGITIACGLSSDELLLYNTTISDYYQLYSNALTSNNGIISSNLWTAAFSYVYNINAVIEGLENSTTIRDSVKNEIMGEAKFIRAFTNFYLLNLFGDIPLVTTTNWRQTSLLSRTSLSDVYKFILTDLKDAQDELPLTYTVGKGERIVPNKWAVTAFLARVYLYLKDWKNAEIQASELLKSGSPFSLTSDLDNVFKPNSSEAIWQLKQDNTSYTYNGTQEGSRFVPGNNAAPFFFLTDQVLNSFSSADKRKVAWTKSLVYAGSTYYYPFKYKIGASQAVVNGAYSEYYTVFRLAEQYLIRSEARAQQDNLIGAISDLNATRTRAGLSILGSSLTKKEVLDSLENEKRIELFCEWGHRWFDLNRNGHADSVLGAIKGVNWQSSDKLYPIPLSELAVDPNLTQNPGYN